MRLVYVLLTYLLAPVVIAMEAWKALTSPEYRGRLGQRLGFRVPLPPTDCLWVHGVSVGEVQAAAALLQALRRRHPEVPVVVTTVTPTGMQRARALFGDTVQHCYLPYDRRARCAASSTALAHAWRSSSRPRSGRRCTTRSAAAAYRW